MWHFDNKLWKYISSIKLTFIVRGYFGKFWAWHWNIFLGKIGFIFQYSFLLAQYTWSISFLISSFRMEHLRLLRSRWLFFAFTHVVVNSCFVNNHARNPLYLSWTGPNTPFRSNVSKCGSYCVAQVFSTDIKTKLIVRVIYDWKF